MLVTCWSTKGGSGTTVVAALAGLCAAQDRDRPVLLVDLGGDLPAVFGGDGTSSGLGEWLRSDLAPCSLDQVLEELTPNLSLLPRGRGELSTRRADEFLEWATTGAAVAGAIVIVDAGVLGGDADCSDRCSGSGELRRRLAAGADRSVLVTRACYLALRRTVSLPVQPNGVVLVAESGRALTRSDCERATGTPVLATVAVDPDIARAVDAGMLSTRLPKGAVRALGRLFEEV